MQVFKRTRGGPARVTALAGLIGLVLIVAGCGSSSKSTTTATSGGGGSTTASHAATSTKLSGGEPIQKAVAPRTGTGTPIKIAVMSDCQGAFGSVRQSGPGRRRRGDVPVRRRKAGQPEQPARRLDRWGDRRPSAEARRDRLLQRLGRHRDQGDPAPDGTGQRRHDDRPALGRRVDRGRELRQAAPHEDVRRWVRGRAGHHAQGAGAELLPLQRGRRDVERRPRRPRLQQAALENRGGHLRRLQLRLDVHGRIHRRLLRGRRTGHQADLPTAEHHGLLVLRAAGSRPTWTATSSPSAARA